MSQKFYVPEIYVTENYVQDIYVLELYVKSFYVQNNLCTIYVMSQSLMYWRFMY